jgi:hypothetical protein
VGSTTSLDDVEKTLGMAYRDPNSDLSVVQPVANRYTGYDIPALDFVMGKLI